MRRLLPVLFVVVALAACGHKKATGPAWPEPSKNEGGAEDGGESLAPRETSTVAAAIEKSEEPAAKKDDEKVADAPAAAGEEKAPTVSAPTQPVTDDIIMSDEIIIEIED
jgi:hypothetical protein